MKYLHTYCTALRFRFSQCAVLQLSKTFNPDERLTASLLAKETQIMKVGTNSMLRTYMFSQSKIGIAG